MFVAQPALDSLLVISCPLKQVGAKAAVEQPIMRVD